MTIIGVASSDLSDDDLRQRAHDAVVESVGDDFDSVDGTTSPRG